MAKYDEGRRNDPKLLALVEKRLEAQEEAAVAALALVRKASLLLGNADGGLSEHSEMALYGQAQREVWGALGMLQRLVSNRGDSSNPIYVGNLAASPVGEAIQKAALK